MTTLLTAQANGFDIGLDELGFGADDPINGGDCVEFIDQNLQLLRRLPALCELADAVDKFLRHAGEMPTTSDFDKLEAALNKVKS